MLRQEAVEAMEKLKIRKYRKPRLGCVTTKQQEQAKTEREVCAVCLDEFRNNQV